MVKTIFMVEIDTWGPKPEGIKLPEFGTVRLIEATNAEGCVDPRRSLVFIEPKGELAEAMNYNPYILRLEHHDGAERSPGASFGKAMSLAGAVPDLSPEWVVDLVREWEESEGRIFTLHGDDQGYGLGCGHIDRASQKTNEGLYGLPSKRVLAMRDYLVDRVRRREITLEVPLLTHTHREKGVLVVLSDDRTVMATDGKEEFFRFDASRHDKSLERLANFAQARGVGVSADALKQAAKRQRDATLILLAPNLPIFEIDLYGQKQSIIPRGRVPQRG